MFINYCRHWTIRFYSLAYFAVSGLIWSVSWEKVAIERASITSVPPRYLSPALRGPTGDNQGMYQQYVDSHINDMSDEQLSAVVWWLMTVFLTATPRIPVSEGERPVPEWPGGQYQPVGISEFQKIKWNLWKNNSLFHVSSLTLKVPVAPRGWAGEIWLFTCVKVWPFNKWMLKQSACTDGSVSLHCSETHAFISFCCSSSGVVLGDQRAFHVYDVWARRLPPQDKGTNYWGSFWTWVIKNIFLFGIESLQLL